MMQTLMIIPSKLRVPGTHVRDLSKEPKIPQALITTPHIFKIDLIIVDCWLHFWSSYMSLRISSVPPHLCVKAPLVKTKSCVHVQMFKNVYCKKLVTVPATCYNTESS